MIFGLDHLVILVRDLDAAVRDYTELGFTVVPGGEHTGGVSHNALISFDDGSYIELFAFKGDAPPDHPFYREGLNEGPVTFALLPDNIESTVEEAQQRGLAMEPPKDGGRLRPDGRRIEWRTSQPPARYLPFLCADVTPRDLRVPWGEALKHPNGVSGITRVHVAVDNPEQAVADYSALLGLAPEQGWKGGVASFQLGSTAVELFAGEEGAQAWLLGIWVDVHLPVPEVEFDLERTHNVSIEVDRGPLKVDSVADEYEMIGWLRCNMCGEKFTPTSQALIGAGSPEPQDRIIIRCQGCGRTGYMLFDISSFFGK